mmetsp:Transcript_3175/g.9679  ORF Transcript_3175/g.9679 Transcript_3175/m.9679 type:complete len:249 (+) Transcript_3175:152-898(+)
MPELQHLVAVAAASAALVYLILVITEDDGAETRDNPPRAVKRTWTFEARQRLADDLSKLPAQCVNDVVQIVSPGRPFNSGDKFQVDFTQLDETTCAALRTYVDAHVDAERTPTGTARSSAAGTPLKYPLSPELRRQSTTGQLAEVLDAIPGPRAPPEEEEDEAAALADALRAAVAPADALADREGFSEDEETQHLADEEGFAPSPEDAEEDAALQDALAAALQEAVEASAKISQRRRRKSGASAAASP